MKNKTLYFSAILCLLIFLNSCATSNNAIEQTKPAIEKNIEKPQCFVQYADGKIKNYATLQLVTSMFTAPHLLADGKIKIMSNEVKAYRDFNFYAITQKDFYTKTKGYVAKDVLPGFAVRVVKGNLNLYSLQFYNGQTVYEKFFLQYGDEGQITPYTPKLLNQYLKDNTEVTTYINNRKKKISPKQLVSLVDNYNNGLTISKN
jgi:hypothetical protein